MKKPVSNQADYNHFYRTEESQLPIHKIKHYGIQTVRSSLSASYTACKNEGKNSIDIVSLPELPVCEHEVKTSHRRTRNFFTRTQSFSVAVSARGQRLHKRSWISKLSIWSRKCPLYH